MSINTLAGSLTRATAAVLICGLLLLPLVGCTTTVTATAGVSQQQGAHAEVGIKIVWDPPGSYLADFDASQALVNLSLSNATISATSGTAVVTVKDLTTGQTVGQQSFGYVVNGNSLYAQNPTTVYNWLQQFTGYSSVDVSVDVTPSLETTTEGSASVTSNAQYKGTTYASATAGWEYRLRCVGHICPDQE